MSNGNFEQSYGRTVESEKRPVGIWERISGKALAALEREGRGISPEALGRAKDLLKNPKFMREIRERWDEQTLSDNIDTDPEKQDDLWAQGLASVLKDRIDN